MNRVKIDYGIDLGTTNSAIAKMDNGEAKIVKSDTQKDTMPSCVHFRKNTILVGDTAYSRISDEHLQAFGDFSKTGNTGHKFNTFIEFKRTMGTDKTYKSNSAEKDLTSEELSSEVLIALKNFVRDEDISSVVITVPARFRNNQIDATQKAAQLAGFKYCELLMEPIAASIAYGVSSKRIDGYWLVFDFGGGTFDAALMKVEEGIMKVVDTDGDNPLGGKDLDYAIVDHIIIPYLSANFKVDKILASEYGKSELREALKSIAEEAKISISPPSKSATDICTYKPLGEDDDGNEMEIDMKMSLQQYEEAVAPIFQRAIDISKKLVEKNNLKTSDLEMVLLVGGPTLSQTMRRMLKEELQTEIDTSIDPMTSVAVGACLFASSKNIPAHIQERDKNKIQLILRYPENTVETEEDIGIKIDRTQTLGKIPTQIFVELSRKDKGWSTGKVLIQDDAEIIPLLLTAGKSNGFDISLFDEKGNLFPCEPSSISIIQGFQEPPATLPFDLCIEAFSGDADKKMMAELQGLGKNQSLPAKGKGSFKTQKDIRPGNPDDKIKIPIYEGDRNTRAVYNKFVRIVVITGEDLPKFLPKGSEIEISIEVNKSRGISLKAYFPDIDETIEKDWGDAPKDSEENADQLELEIKEAMATLNKLESESATFDLSAAQKIKDELAELSELLANGRTDFNTKTKVKDRLCGVLKELDSLEEVSLFPKVEEELNKALDELRNNQERYGTTQTSPAVDQLEKIAASVIKEMNVIAAKQLITQILQFNWALIDQGAGVALDISYIKQYDDQFASYNWKNPGQARELINRAKEIIAQNPTRGRLRPIIQDLWQLIPDKEKAAAPSGGANDDEYLAR